MPAGIYWWVLLIHVNGSSYLMQNSSQIGHHLKYAEKIHDIFQLHYQNNVITTF